MANLEATLYDINVNKDWLYGEDQKWRRCVKNYGRGYVVLDNNTFTDNLNFLNEVVKPDWFCDIELTINELKNKDNYIKTDKGFEFSEQRADELFGKVDDELKNKIVLAANSLYPNPENNISFIGLVIKAVSPESNITFTPLELEENLGDDTITDLSKTTWVIYRESEIEEDDLVILQDWYLGNLIEAKLIDTEDNALLCDVIYPKCVMEGAIQEKCLSEMLCAQAGEPPVEIDYLIEEFNRSGSVTLTDFNYKAVCGTEQPVLSENVVDIDRIKRQCMRYAQKKHYFKPIQNAPVSMPVPKREKKNSYYEPRT